MKRIKEGYGKFKELWKDPRKHDIISLGLWFLFIFGVIVFFRFNTTTSSNDTGQIENSVNSVSGYEFTYNFEKMQISGFSYDDKMLFNLNNDKYYVNDKVYLIKDDTVTLLNDFDLKSLKIDYNFLNNLVTDITPIDNGEYEMYVVPLDRFINLYDVDTELDLSGAMNYNIVVSIYKRDGYIHKVVLDLSNYYLYNGFDIYYPVSIYFYNVNNVSDFSLEYEKMLGVIN